MRNLPRKLKKSLRFVRPDGSSRGRAPQVDLSHEHHVDDMQAVIASDDHRRPPAGPQRNEIGMRDVYSRSVRQANGERQKWCRVDHLTQMLCPHWLNSATVLIVGCKVFHRLYIPPNDRARIR